MSRARPSSQLQQLEELREAVWRQERRADQIRRAGYLTRTPHCTDAAIVTPIYFESLFLSVSLFVFLTLVSPPQFTVRLEGAVEEKVV